MPRMKLIGGTDASPEVAIGRPETDRHGLSTFPVVVALPDRDLVWGTARMHWRWSVPEVSIDCPTVTVRLAVERTVAALMAQCVAAMKADQADAETRCRLQAQNDDAERKMQALSSMIAENRESLSRLTQHDRWV